MIPVFVSCSVCCWCLISSDDKGKKENVILSAGKTIVETAEQAF